MDKQTLLNEYLPFLPPALRSLNWRPHPRDGKLLLFERDSGLNILLEGDETSHLRQLAPRNLLIAVTNACNMTCSFCYRDLTSPSDWRYNSLLEFCQQAAEWGVLEVAFGGGEPTIFPRWAELMHELYATTHLALNFTTNGTQLTAEFLRDIAGKYGQIRLSLYEDNHWPQTIELLASEQARFGVNWLITPAELDAIQTKFDQLLDLGVRDFLLIGYKGNEFPAMHFTPEDYGRFEKWLNTTYDQYGDTVTLKLDVCWGKMLPNVPRLFQQDDCGAGADFLSITSDKQIKPCSFAQGGIPFDTLADVKAYWEATHHQKIPVRMGGCGRLPQRGLGGHDEIIHLATI